VTHRGNTRPVRRPAFSLVELLVVVTIIVLLIAILLPALSRARDRAATVKCMSNLRQLSTVYALYAQDNGQRVPIGYCNAMPWTGYFLWSGTVGPGNGFPLMGCLYKEGLLSAPKAFYCPSQTNASWQFNTPKNPWPTEGIQPPINTQVRVGYTSRPAVEWDPNTSWVKPNTRMVELKDLYGKAILADIVGIPKNSPDATTVHHRALNVLYGDGNVQNVSIAAYKNVQSLIEPYNAAPNQVPLSLYLDDANPAANALWNIFDRY